MTKSPLITVIIPSYFHEAYIKEAIDSVLDQTHTNLELIIIDDGSKDRSHTILNNIRDRRVQVVFQKNAGAHNAINAGLKRSKGEFLTILNSDDVFAVDRLELMLEHMLTEGADLSCSWIQQIDHSGMKGGLKKGWSNELPGWARTLGTLNTEPENNFLYQLLRTNFPSTTSNLMFSRKVYEACGGMRNLRFAHDWDFALRVAVRFKCTMVSYNLMYYRTHGTNTISSNPEWMIFEILLVLAIHFPSVAQAMSVDDIVALETVHFGSLDPVYGQLRQRFENVGDGDTFTMGDDLLGSTSLRAPFINDITYS